jgi:hypothetical protein
MITWIQYLLVGLMSREKQDRDARASQQSGTGAYCGSPKSLRQHLLGFRGKANQLFSFRSQHAVKHDEELKKEFPNPEYPDRVIGLRCTDFLRRLLKAAYNYPKDINYARFSSLNSTGNRQSPPLFPFLVLESKKEAFRFRDIDLQTAGVIRTFLRTQEGLQFSAGLSERVGGPLVWYFPHIGSLWELKIGYIVQIGGRKEYVMFAFAFEVV